MRDEIPKKLDLLKVTVIFSKIMPLQLTPWRVLFLIKSMASCFNYYKQIS